MKLTIASLIFFFCLSLSGLNQSSMSDSSINVSLAGVNFGTYIPGGDLAKRFGLNYGIGLNYVYKTTKQWEFGAEYQYLFGNKVKNTSMLDDLTTEVGGIINTNGQFAIVNTFERGHSLSIKAGRLFGNIGPNPNCGIFVHLGIGLLIHKVKFINQNEDVPQFNINDRAYLPGYDRYTSGFSLNQSVGYRFLSNNGLVNFQISFQFTEAFTKLRRDYQVDYPANFENKGRLDILSGIQLGWIVPIYKRPSKDFYY